MTSTITTTGWVIPAEQLAWDRSDWIDAYQDHCGDTYASSVIWATDDRCLLAMADLDSLLRHHGATVAGLQEELTIGQQQGAAVLPLAHAAQALAWLGY